MANLTVKDLPDTLYEKLKAQARANRRSIASETQVILERALGERLLRVNDLIQISKEVRESAATYLTEDERKRATESGRAR